MEVSGEIHTPAALLPGKEPGTHWIGGWVGPRVGLDAVAKRRNPLSPNWESNPWRLFRTIVTTLTDLKEIPWKM